MFKRKNSTQTYFSKSKSPQEAAPKNKEKRTLLTFLKQESAHQHPPLTISPVFEVQKEQKYLYDVGLPCLIFFLTSSVNVLIWSKHKLFFFASVLTPLLLTRGKEM